MQMLELYRLPGCPYCAKVERKLDELGLEYEQHNVLPFRFLRFEVKSISGQAGVPVLVDPEHGIDGMAESDDIVEYLEETYN
ncbi:glutathione S-transferase N-terminal domain-containing protein [Salinigranum marinum]|uniref:glutathione S-transferase N-terminal domain-containing protein n=1 Tax=Salinigranum marinum TaxID=1515595 RepID=UPI002989CFF0|nr:glutathione S-transferase N-terminal domain-containing protein [Salinigranum marinum]